MLISCFLCSLTPGSQGLSTRKVSQESSLDLGPVYSSSQITRAQRGMGRRWPERHLMGQPRVTTGAEKESTHSFQQPAQPWEGPAPAAPGILCPCWQRALEAARPNFRQVHLQSAGFPMTQDNSMYVTTQAQAGRPGTPQLGSCHQTNCGKTPPQALPAGLPARLRFPQLELDHNPCSYRRHCRALLLSEFLFPYQKQFFSAEATGPANKTSRWDLRFHNTAHYNESLRLNGIGSWAGGRDPCESCTASSLHSSLLIDSTLSRPPNRKPDSVEILHVDQSDSYGYNTGTLSL